MINDFLFLNYHLLQATYTGRFSVQSLGACI